MAKNNHYKENKKAATSKAGSIAVSVISILIAVGTVVLIGAVNIVVRCVGKYFGARASSAAAGCDRTVRRYLGITLFPQAGVALGMVVTAQALGGTEAVLIRNIILLSVLVYELFGPSLTRRALASAGEIAEAGADKKTRERFPHRK